ncbi:phage portal protein family protein [Kushneria phyllosphaerae]|uniref:Portal protein n=1 Tax=Kushneria phyllosphaerae TaxID=2100822 RepID=A0A2R8CIQ4_9GAMM|nr:hypothetical protein [Kushneria phyllosphaerae]SPJ32692.1 hypothetical protein KSP9073_00693 [Kushneria phyllosphaerae]
MANLQRQQSSPLHIENSIIHSGRRELSPELFPQTARDMMQDSTISGAMAFIKSILNKPFRIEYHEKSTQAEKALIDDLNTSLGSLNSYTPYQLMSNILGACEYGYSVHEVVLTRNSNGRMVFGNISPIHPSTINRFQFDNGRLKQLELGPVQNDGKVVDISIQRDRTINGDKVLLFRLNPSQDNPLGTSMLHSVWSAWKQKSVIEEYSLIAVAKNMSGVLNIELPSEYISKFHTDPMSDEAMYVQQVMDQAQLMHAGKSSFVMTPSDVYDGGQRMFNVTTIGTNTADNAQAIEHIQRLDTAILISLQSLILQLGADSNGSNALSESKTYLLEIFVSSLQRMIADEFAKALKMAFKANGMSEDRLPRIVFEDTTEVDWDVFSKAFQRLTQSGAITPDRDLENHIRDTLGAPRSSGYQRSQRAQAITTADPDERLETDKQA